MQNNTPQKTESKKESNERTNKEKRRATYHYFSSSFTLHHFQKRASRFLFSINAKELK